MLEMEVMAANQLLNQELKTIRVRSEDYHQED